MWKVRGILTGNCTFARIVLFTSLLYVLSLVHDIILVRIKKGEKLPWVHYNNDINSNNNSCNNKKFIEKCKMDDVHPPIPLPLQGFSQVATSVFRVRVRVSPCV